MHLWMSDIGVYYYAHLYVLAIVRLCIVYYLFLLWMDCDLFVPFWKILFFHVKYS